MINTETKKRSNDINDLLDFFAPHHAHIDLIDDKINIANALMVDSDVIYRKMKKIVPNFNIDINQPKAVA